MIVGEGAHRPALESLVKEMGLEGKAKLMGFRKDAFDLMSAAHVFWHLSESEGLPMVVLEAMATGLPVVGFDVRGTRDVVVDGETGYLVPFGDVEAVAQKTVDILADATSYRSLSYNARHRVEQFFSLERMVDGHERILTANIDRGGKS
jgi:glycosyltransferase involved in cell wall biosynthesis